jgi:hypothetical protein
MIGINNSFHSTCPAWFDPSLFAQDYHERVAARPELVEGCPGMKEHIHFPHKIRNPQDD